MNKKIFFFGAVILVGALWYFLIGRSDTSAYDLATVERGTLVQEVSANGTVEPTTRVDLQFKNSGAIAEIRAQVGQAVKKGDIVAKQDTSVLASQLRQYEAELVNQEYKLQSVVKNDAKKSDEEQYLINAQRAIVDKARADIRTQGERIGETVLAAPMDGVIVAVNGEVGEIAKPETIVVSIASTDAPHIDVDIPETTVADVAVGQTVRITLDAFDNGASWSGKVSSMDPAESVRGGAVYYEATVSFEREDGRMRPGMTANVWIKTAVAEDVLFVPASAIQAKEGKKIIQVLEGGQMVEREIATGIKDDAGMVEIVSGLSQGEQVILGRKK